ncbi:hypothetical protein KSP40_PGU009354 [Platanthera guangdongensis]|uniref:Uncharacterized protein n=1 Tax=Platanthera guangdongensis TaxID=2320717 RepID=A0ABR2LDN5_9ASPA
MSRSSIKSPTTLLSPPPSSMPRELPLILSQERPNFVNIFEHHGVFVSFAASNYNELTIPTSFVKFIKGQPYNLSII